MSGLTPAFIILLCSLVVSVFLVKKEHIIVPIIVAMCFLPGDIAVTIADLNFFPIRILALSCLVRLMLTPNDSQLRCNSIDLLFFFYCLLGAIIYIIASENKTGAMIYKAGVFVDSIILYLVFRRILNSTEIIHLATKTFSICIILLAPFIIFEYFSATNLFSILGRSQIVVRGDEVRAAASFNHAILLGSFAVALIPLFWAYYRITRNVIYLISVVCCIFFTFACSSSGPIVTLACVIFLLFFFRSRLYSGLLVWFIVFTVTFIHFAREKSLWHFLYVRVPVKASSTGHHRYLLTEAAAKEFKNWWLLGYGDMGADWHTKYWPWIPVSFTDVTNQYLLEGVLGGIVPMGIFIILCFKSIKILATESIKSSQYENQWIYWGFLAMMIGHCITFLSIAYFGQITMLLYFTFAVAGYTQGLKHIDDNTIVGTKV